MRFTNYLISFLLFFLLSFCTGRTLPELKNFDKDIWVSDKLACKNQRAQYKTSLQEQTAKLKALNEKDIIRLLGKPDQNELMPRNQKHYSWFIEPGPECPDAEKNKAQKLIIRFNATGLAQEIGFE